MSELTRFNLRRDTPPFARIHSEICRTMSDSFEALSAAQRIQHLAEVASRALVHWPVSAAATLTLLNISENATYRLDDPASPVPRIVRVHRTGYHTHNAVLTELAWMKALHDEAGMATPQALPALDGELVKIITTPALAEARFVVMFAFIEGHEPAPGQLIEPFKRLGALTAQMHLHARGWQRPAYFERLVWDFEGSVGSRGNWGDWRDGLAMTPEREVILAQAVRALEIRLKHFGMGPERFGLIHADLRLANLLVTPTDTRVIDFDDAGLGWFMYDLASALSFMEEHADIDPLIAAWLGGYRSVAPLSRAEEDEIPTFLLLRRLTILAWTGSHPDTDLARTLGPEYTAGSVRLAQRYLATTR